MTHDWLWDLTLVTIGIMIGLAVPILVPVP